MDPDDVKHFLKRFEDRKRSSKHCGEEMAMYLVSKGSFEVADYFFDGTPLAVTRGLVYPHVVHDRIRRVGRTPLH